MAFSGVTNRGFTVSSSSGTTVAVNPTATVVVNKLLIAVVTWDNESSASIADSSNNTWTKAYERFTINKGTAIFFTKVSSNLTTSTTVTATFGQSATRKIIQISEATIDTSKNIEYVNSYTDDFEHTFSGYTSRDYLHWGLCSYYSVEGTINTATPGAFFTEYVDRITALSGSDELNIHGQYRINTSTGETITTTPFEGGFNVSGQVQMATSFYEVSASTDVTATPTANTYTETINTITIGGDCIITLDDDGIYFGYPVAFTETLLNPVFSTDIIVLTDPPTTHSLLFLIEEYDPTIRFDYIHILPDLITYTVNLQDPQINIDITETPLLLTYTETAQDVAILTPATGGVSFGPEYSEDGSPWLKIAEVDTLGYSSNGDPFYGNLTVASSVDVIIIPTIQNYVETIPEALVILDIIAYPTTEGLIVTPNDVEIGIGVIIPVESSVYTILQGNPTIDYDWIEIVESISFIEVLNTPQINLGVTETPLKLDFTESLQSPQINLGWVEIATLNLLTETLYGPQINLGNTETLVALPYTETLYSPQVNLDYVQTVDLITFNLTAQIADGVVDANVTVLIDPYPTYSESLMNPQINVDWTQIATLNIFTETLFDVTVTGDAIVVAGLQSYTEILPNVTINVDWTEITTINTFAETIQNVTINLDWVEVATTNNYTETINTPTIIGDVIIVTVPISYIETLPDVTVKLDWTEIATLNTFTENIQNVTINFGWTEIATINNFTLNLQSPEVLLTSDIIVISEVNSYLITESIPIINLDWIETHSVNAFTINLLDVTIIADFEHIEYPLAIPYTELLGNVTVVTDQVITADLLTYNETLQDVTLLEGFGVIALADSLSYSISVLDPDLSLGGTSGADISFFGQTWIPSVDNASTPLGSATPHTIVPPSSMISGQLVILAVGVRDNTAPAIVNAGGQTWNSETMNTNGTTNAIRMFWCIFNGTWSANPTFSTASSTQGVVAWMGVYNNINTGDAFDVNPTAIDFTATTSKTLTSFNTGVAKTWAHFIWCEQDDNVLTPTSWTGPDGQNGPLHNHVGNMGGTDLGLFVLMKNMPTAGATQDEVVSTGADLGTGYYFSIISGATATTDIYVTADLLVYNESLLDVTIIVENLVVINETVIIGSAESYTITQYDPQINLGNTETPNFIPYTVGLNTVDTLYDYAVSTDLQSYIINLQDVTIVTEAIVVQTVESYTIELLDPTIILDAVILQDAISFTETINDVSIIIDVTTTADPSTYNITLYDVSTTINETVLVDSVPYIITLQDVSIKIDVICELTLETYVETLISPTVNLDWTELATVNSFTETLKDPQINSDIIESSSVISYTETLVNPVINLDWTEITTLQPYTITLNNPTVVINIICTPSTENLIISQLTPVINIDWVEFVSLIDFNLTLQDVTVISTTDYIYLADAISFTETVQDVTVIVEENVIVQVTNENYNLLLNNESAISLGDTEIVSTITYPIMLGEVSVTTDSIISIEAPINYNIILNNINVIIDIPIPVTLEPYIINLYDIAISTEANIIMAESLNFLVSLPDVTVNWGHEEVIDNILYVIAQSDVTIIGDSVSEVDTLLFDLGILPADAGDLEGVIRVDNLIYNIHTFYPRIDVGEVFRHDFRLKKKYIMHKK